MRVLFSGIMAAGLLTGQLASAECVRPTDHAALDVAGLKSQLMVIALTCHAQDRYNAFVTKFRPELQSEAKLESGYFSRAYGRNGTKRHDDYVTQLANAKSQTGLQAGSLFCDRNLPVFDEVLSLKSGSELEQYAAGRATATPTVLTACASEPERAKATRSASRNTRSRHRS